MNFGPVTSLAAPPFAPHVNEHYDTSITNLRSQKRRRSSISFDLGRVLDIDDPLRTTMGPAVQCVWALRIHHCTVLERSRWTTVHGRHQRDGRQTRASVKRELGLTEREGSCADASEKTQGSLGTRVYSMLVYLTHWKNKTVNLDLDPTVRQLFHKGQIEKEKERGSQAIQKDLTNALRRLKFALDRRELIVVQAQVDRKRTSTRENRIL